MRNINNRNCKLKKIKEKHDKAANNLLKLKTERKFKLLKLKTKRSEEEKVNNNQKIASKYDRAVNNHEKHINERINRLKIHHSIVTQRLAENKENTKDKENIKPNCDKQNSLS